MHLRQCPPLRDQTERGVFVLTANQKKASDPRHTAYHPHCMAAILSPIRPAPASLTIAIDFDNTWTADPDAWYAFYVIMRDRGHQVIIATGRSERSDDMDRFPLPEGMPVIFCGRGYKEPATRAAGYHVHIWIDDLPCFIQPPRLPKESPTSEL